MITTKVAIYGHYDSRGGGTAVRLPSNATGADLERAHQRYDEEFGYDPKEGYERPSAGDFLHVAEIHSEQELPEGELDWNYVGEAGQAGIVVRERTQEDDDADNEELQAQKMREWQRAYEAEASLRRSDPYQWQRQLDERIERGNREYEEREAIRRKEAVATLHNPVQLEFIPVDEEWVKQHQAIQDEHQAKLTEANLPWLNRTQEQEEKHREIGKWIATQDKAHQAKLLSRAKVIKRPIDANYGEDACGLILV